MALLVSTARGTRRRTHGDALREHGARLGLRVLRRNALLLAVCAVAAGAGESEGGGGGGGGSGGGGGGVGPVPAAAAADPLPAVLPAASVARTLDALGAASVVPFTARDVLAEAPFLLAMLDAWRRQRGVCIWHPGSSTTKGQWGADPPSVPLGPIA